MPPWPRSAADPRNELRVVALEHEHARAAVVGDRLGRHPCLERAGDIAVAQTVEHDIGSSRPGYRRGKRSVVQALGPGRPGERGQQVLMRALAARQLLEQRYRRGWQVDCPFPRLAAHREDRRGGIEVAHLGRGQLAQPGAGQRAGRSPVRVGRASQASMRR